MSSPVLASVAWSPQARRLSGRPAPAAAAEVPKAGVGMILPPGAASVPRLPGQEGSPEGGNQAAMAAAREGGASQRAAGSLDPRASDAADGMARDAARDAARGAARQEGHREGHAKGYQEGRQEGLEKGAAEGQALWQAEVDRLAALLDALESRAAETIQGWEGPLVELTLAACRKVLGGAAVSGQAAAAVVRQALQNVRKETLIEVRVNPADLAFLRESVMPEGEAAVPWRGDASVGRGGCMVAFAGGTLDARIETQLRRIAQVLAAEVVSHD